MSNAILNVRFGEWHLKILKDRPWITVSHNDYHALERRRDACWQWFAIYEAPWK